MVQIRNSIPKDSGDRMLGLTSRKDVFKFLLASQHWSATKLQELQWEKINSLLSHAYDTCAFYRHRFDASRLHPSRDFHSFECLQKLPVLTKADIQRDLESMKTSDPNVTGIELNSTGGSTGMPLNFYQDSNYLLWAAAARDRAWRFFPGVSKRSIEAILWGAVRDVGRGFSLRSIIKSLLRHRSFALNTFDLDAPTIRKFFIAYNVVRPQILRGYASSLYFVANFLEAEGIRVHKPHVIISSAEVLWPSMREKISAVFSADVIDSYGCREVSQIATECTAHNGLHLVMENQYVEVVDGQIIVTSLNNFGMPFIRYQLGDMADYIETSPCACGREAYRLMGLMGRDNDNITLPSGKTINGEFFEFLFFGLRTVEQFQVVYSREEEQLRVRLKVTDQSENVATMVHARIRDSFNFTNVKVEFTEAFGKTPTGKLRFVYTVDRFEEPSCHVA
jgi:phenylacetate-CoA ligase